MLAAMVVRELTAQLFLSESNSRIKDTMYLVENKVIHLLVLNVLANPVA